MATINKIDEIKIEDNFFKSYNLGYKNLDEILGGVKDGSVITIAARPGMGKTNFLHNIMINMLGEYNLPTLYVSLEDNNVKSLIKLAALSTKTPYYSISEDKTLTNKTMDKFLSQNYNLYLSDDCFTILELEQLMEKNKKIKFLFINYIQLIKNEQKFTSSSFQCNDIVERIHLLAKKYKLVVFLTSQLSRSVEKRKDHRPLLSDLKYKGLESISDVVIMLYRDRCGINDNKNINEIIISKNRHGGVGVIQLKYDDELLSFSCLD